MAECNIAPFTSKYGPQVLGHCKTFADSAPVYAELDFDPKGCLAFLQRYLPPHDTKIGFVAVADEKVVGFILVSTYKHPCLHGLLSADDLFYVEPSYRRKGAGRLLAQAYTEWAKDRAKVVLMGSSSGILPDHADKFYREAGYTPCGVLAKLGD